ncbi:MAG: hypothetical protein A3F41_05885 [Coxiella sp. RIFCSPHIGHO2_12_FULL_44_14]|nr:MAG: hypothetical protein A3F41_05885 [Coxiella sp. RIFCSPHIGHO2_12_FULL_44_14]
MLNRSLITYASTFCLLLAVSSPSLAESVGQTANQSSSSSSSAATSSDVQQYVSGINPPPATPTKTSKKNSRFGLGTKSRIQINGFLSAGASQTTTKTNYSIPGHGSVNNETNYMANSLIGAQITANMTHDLAAVLQLLANGNDTDGNKPYRVQAEWAFLRYSPSPAVQLRAGRFRIPALLYSDTEEVGYTYPWVTLPNEVYRILPFNDMNGVDMIYSHALGDGNWVIKSEPYVGTNQSQYDLYTNAPDLIPAGTTATFNENDVLGDVVSISNQYVTLRGDYTRANLTGYIPALSAIDGATLPLFNNQEASFYSLGSKLDYHHLLLVGEYAHRDAPAHIADLTGYYGMVGYRLGKLLPNFTYARIKTSNTTALETTPFAELPESQRSYTLGADYYINHNLVAKVGISEITPLDGTDGLFEGPVGHTPVYLYSASLDVIF